MGTPTEMPRRRYVFSLRTMMITVLIVAVLLSVWAAYRVNRGKIQRQAVAQIQSTGGTVVYDYNNLPPDTPAAIKQAAKPAGPSWLRKLFGDESFQEVAGVKLQGPVAFEAMDAIGSLDRLEWISIKTESRIDEGIDTLVSLPRLKEVTILGPCVNDASLAKLGKCTNLELIWLWKADVSSGGVAQLAGMPKLKTLILNLTSVIDTTVEDLVPTLPNLTTLDLQYTGITDKALITIGRKTQLESLRLSQTKVTARAMENLKGLTRLQMLTLDGSEITDASLANLSEMTELKTLSLNQTKITGEGFKHLGKLQKLSTLTLFNSDFSDEGMPYLAKLTAMQHLWLRGSKISDAGLAYLQGMPNLTDLYTEHTRVTDVAYDAFRKANPNITKGLNTNRGIRTTTAQKQK